MCVQKKFVVFISSLLFCCCNGLFCNLVPVIYSVGIYSITLSFAGGVSHRLHSQSVFGIDNFIVFNCPVHREGNLRNVLLDL